MKRFWLLLLMLAGSMAVLTAPAMAKGDEGDDSSESLEDVNSGLGALSARVGDIEKKLGFSFYGDVRTRFFYQTQSQSEPLDAAAKNTGVSVIADKSVGRYRARFGIKKDSGEFQGGLRLSTGQIATSAGVPQSNPNSENQTFDNGFGDPAIVIDQAFLTFVPNFLEKHLKLNLGKMGNPLLTTPMTWDPDICPEGAELELNASDTIFRMAYFDLNNLAGTAPSLTNPNTGNDEYMMNFQLEHLFKLEDKTSVNLMMGYEWVNNVSALAGGTAPFSGPGGASAAFNTKNTPVGSGNIFDFGNVIPDFNVGEAMLQVKHNVADIPFQWTLHVIDNFGSFNVPNTERSTAGPSGTKAVAGYTTWTNQYGFYLECKGGNTQKGNFMGVAAMSYVEPNAQLANLASDDANFTNTEYLFQQVGYGLEDNVTFLLSAWELEHIYDYYGNTNNKFMTSGGTSKSPELQLYADCVLSL